MSRTVIKLIDLQQGRSYLLYCWKWECLYEHQQNLLALNVTLSKTNSQPLELRNKIQKQRQSGSSLPFLSVQLSTSSYLEAVKTAKEAASTQQFHLFSSLILVSVTLESSNKSLGSCPQLGRWRKSVMFGILVDCKIQIFLVLLPVLHNPPIAAWVVFWGWYRQNIKANEWAPEKAEKQTSYLEVVPKIEEHWARRKLCPSSNFSNEKPCRSVFRLLVTRASWAGL